MGKDYFHKDDNEKEIWILIAFVLLLILLCVILTSAPAAQQMWEVLSSPL